MIIYMATNKVNGKKYIGQTVQEFRVRKGQHLRRAMTGTKYPLYNAIRKYGAAAFTWEILDTVGDMEELNAREVYFIAAYETLAYKGKGYNVQSGAGNSRKPLSTRKKLSVAHTGKTLSEEHRKRIGKGGKGKQAGGKNSMFDHRVYTFSHREHGKFTGTRYALSVNYGLRVWHLGRVVSGKYKSHKGWTMASNLKEVA